MTRDVLPEIVQHTRQPLAALRRATSSKETSR
jgi:hypothetical protein